MAEESPKPTGRESSYDVTGGVFPWKDGQPFFLRSPGSPLFYIPVFTAANADRLREFMAKVGCADFGTIKQIDDQFEFMDSLPPDVALMIDPWHTPEGRLRWTQPAPPS